MLRKLPGWIVDDVSSVRQEVEEWRHMSAAEVWRLAVLCSRDAIWATRAGGDPTRVLAHVDPLPESSIVALRRLRSATGWGNGPS